MRTEATSVPPVPRALAGARAILPLLLGVVPFGLAYALSARSAGLSLGATQLMSVAVFAGSAQFTAVGLLAAGAGPGTLLATTLFLNARHVLYGLSLGRGLRAGRGGRWLAAYFLTDEAFGVATALGGGDLPFLLGAELALFVIWNLTTLVGSLAVGTIPDPSGLGLDLVFPLTFLGLLWPALRGRREIAAAALAAAAAWLLAPLVSPGPAVLFASIGASVVAAALPGAGARRP
jgi:4-azaleucine resistance transporter AzlC